MFRNVKSEGNPTLLTTALEDIKRTLTNIVTSRRPYRVQWHSGVPQGTVIGPHLKFHIDNGIITLLNLFMLTKRCFHEVKILQNDLNKV